MTNKDVNSSAKQINEEQFEDRVEDAPDMDSVVLNADELAFESEDESEMTGGAQQGDSERHLLAYEDLEKLLIRTTVFQEN